MDMLDRGLADFSSPLAAGDLIGAISRLLVNAEMSLETDLFAAKSLIDQAAALIDWRTELHANPAPIEARAHALAPWQEKRLANYVTIKLASGIRNADLAAEVRLSPSHLIKAFKGSFGLTPQAYVAQCRVQYAKKLMLSTGEPLAQIALACGFADQAHFSTYFRRVTGNTPAQWRRTCAVSSPRPGRTAGCQMQDRAQELRGKVGVAVPNIIPEGDANGTPHPDPDAYAKKFSGNYGHRTIGGGVRHNLPQEAPAAFAQVVFDDDAH